MEKTTIDILLVEDSPTDANLLKQVFLRTEQQKWQITHVERLSEAIDIIRENQHRFDVVLLDLHLPDSTGLDTVKACRAAVSDIPVVVLTALDDEDLALSTMSEGAQDYLVKDQITLQRLLRAIRYAIERGEILKQLRESEELSRLSLAKEQELNELQSSFVAMVSHEFRTPMTTIRTAVEMIEYNNHKLTDERRAKYFHRIQSAINQMLQLLDEVLFLSRTEAAKLEFNPTPLNLASFCRELIEVVQMSAANQHNIIFTAEGECSQAEMDEDLLNYILTNILSNAIKYSIEKGNIWVDLICHDNRVIFRVKDEGRGIPLKDQALLFQSFYRGSNVGKIKGTGLGLAIVKKSVDIHQGEIHLESQPDKGTTVTVTLPLSIGNRE